MHIIFTALHEKRQDMLRLQCALSSQASEFTGTVEAVYDNINGIDQCDRISGDDSLT